MSALIVPFRSVRKAVQMAENIGSDEARLAIVQRVIADIRAGHHRLYQACRTPPERERAVQGGAQ